MKSLDKRIEDIKAKAERDIAAAERAEQSLSIIPTGMRERYKVRTYTQSNGELWITFDTPRYSSIDKQERPTFETLAELMELFPPLPCGNGSDGCFRHIGPRNEVAKECDTFADVQPVIFYFQGDSYSDGLEAVFYAEVDGQRIRFDVKLGRYLPKFGNYSADVRTSHGVVIKVSNCRFAVTNEKLAGCKASTVRYAAGSQTAHSRIAILYSADCDWQTWLSELVGTCK